MRTPYSNTFRRVGLSWLATILLSTSFWLSGLTSARATGLAFSAVTISGTNLVVSGSGGVAGASYYLMASPNLTQSPLVLWNRVATNVFSANGQFTSTSPISPWLPQEFFIITTKQPVTMTGLVAAYAFDEGTGTTAADLSGNGNTGTLGGGVTWTNLARYGASACSFNGSSAGYLTIANAPGLELSNRMTLEAWVYPTTHKGSWVDVIYKGNNGGDDYFLDSEDGSGSSTPAMGSHSWGPSDHLSAPAALPVNTWSYLSATYDQTNVRLYVNAVQVAVTNKTVPLQVTTDPLYIGGDPGNAPSQCFVGMIDEVRLYDVALTAAQIQTDMNTPVGDLPSAPGNLTTATISTGEINLTWNASGSLLGIGAYLVEREDAGTTNFVQIGWTKGTSYNDGSLSGGTNFSYRVRAVDGVGDVGPYSNVAQASTALEITPPVVVLSYNQTQQFAVNYANITVSWSVDGVVGGSTSAGTITGSGLYSAPNNNATHTVTATTSNQTQTASATVYSANPGVFTQHNDNLRTGQNLDEKILNPTNVNMATFGKLFTYPIDGISIASPLYVAGVNVPGNGYHNLVFVATEHDSVYAFDADGLTNNPVWHDSFINPGAGITTVPSADVLGTFSFPTEVGITGTPVIDPTSGILYAVAATKEVSGNNSNYVLRLHALDIRTGAEMFGGPAVIQATVPGTAVGSQGGVITFNSKIENQRPALLLNSNVVYIAFASFGDNFDWNGFVLGYNATNLQQVSAFCTTPNDTTPGGGIWMGGGGIAADTNGNLFFSTGNGTFDANTGGKDYGDSVLQITPGGSVLDYFTPYNNYFLETNDFDLGSSGVLLLPDQTGPRPHLLVTVGKSGTIYLVNRDHMGHYSSSGDTNIVQELANAFPSATPGGSLGYKISPVYFNGKIYFSGNPDYIKAFQLTNGLLSTSPTSQSSELYGYPGAPLAISANATSNGILWAVQRIGSDDSGNGTDAPGTLRAYDPNNLTNVFYDSNQAGSRDTLDFAVRFTVPLVINGKVFVASESELTVYGLLP